MGGIAPRGRAPERDVVITMLPAPPQVEEVLLGPGGLLAGLPPGAIWMDMSTQRARGGGQGAGRGGPRAASTVLDAPVAGDGQPGASAGTLQIFVGGATEDYCGSGRCSRSWGTRSGSCIVGAHGAGYTVKLMLNLLWFADRHADRRGADHRGQGRR